MSEILVKHRRPHLYNQNTGLSAKYHPPSGFAPLRIAMVSARCSPFIGGIESHIHEVSYRLAALGHELTVLTVDPTGNLPSEETRSGVQIKRVRSWLPKSDYYLAPGIYLKIISGDYDIVHIQGYHTFVAPLGMLAAIRTRTPFVVTFHSGGHSSPFRKALRPIQWKTLAPLVRRASLHVGVSEFEADFFSEKMRVPRSNFVVVPNGAQLSDAFPMDRESNEGRVIISIGRLERYKGHHRAIEAMHKLQWRFADVRLVVLGGGPYEAELRRLVKRLRLGRKVTIGSIPPQERPKLASLLSTADLVVLLSEYEAHPVAIMEALSLGRKVLTSDNSGFRELAQKGLIRTVPLESTPVEIAAAMADALEACPKPVAFTLPTWDDCARKLDEIYRNVVRQRV